MTLVGQDGTGWTLADVEPGQAGGNALAFSSGYPGTPGVADTAWVYVGTGACATAALRVSLYDVLGKLINTSNVFTYPSNNLASLLSAPFPPTTITGQVYTLVVAPDAGLPWFKTNSGGNGFVDNQWTAASFPYAAPPAVLPAADVSSVGAEVVAYLTGSPPFAGSGPLPRQLYVMPRVAEWLRRRWFLIPGGAFPCS